LKAAAGRSQLVQTRSGIYLLRRQPVTLITNIDAERSYLAIVQKHLHQNAAFQSDDRMISLDARGSENGSPGCR